MSTAQARLAVSRITSVPPPTELPDYRNLLGAPALAFAAPGTPAPQGSKTPGRRKDGKLFVRESSAGVKDWRKSVVDATKIATGRGFTPLGDARGGLLLDLVFTIKRPADRPKTLRVRPAVTPDIDKLVRATLDALKIGGAISDDGRVVEFRRLAEFYVGDPDPDTLPAPGVLVRIWQLPVEAAA